MTKTECNIINEHPEKMTAAYLSEIRDLLRAQTQMNLLSDLLFHDMISEEAYKSELENIATTEMHMSIKFLK